MTKCSLTSDFIFNMKLKQASVDEKGKHDLFFFFKFPFNMLQNKDCVHCEKVSCDLSSLNSKDHDMSLSGTFRHV